MMKNTILLIFILVSTYLNAQTIDYNTNYGYIANGYDVVSYFDNKAIKGDSDFSYKYDGIKFKFKNKSNLKKFIMNPEKYIPQYGGWCAYAMGENGEKVSINPKTFEIRKGKLYLFYNAFFNNTFESWLEEGAEELRKKADQNWMKINN
jgi:YHS domain-containing protein